MKKIINLLYIFFLILFLTLKSEDYLKIGTILDLNSNSKQIIPGINAVFSKINKNGGLNEKKLKLIVKDDKFDPKIAKEKADELLKDNIDIFLSCFSSYMLSGYIDYIKEKKILVFLPDATASEYRKKENQNIIFFLASADKEGTAIANYALNNLNFKKIAFLYNSEPFCLSALEAAENILNKINKEKKEEENKIKWTKIEDPLNNINISEISKKLKDFNPEGIMLFTFPKNINAILNNLKEEFWTQKYFFGLGSFLISTTMAFILSKNKNLILTQLVPDLNSDLEIIKEYKQDLKDFGFEHNPYALEGYIHASIFVDICKKIKGKITKEKIIEQTENIKDYDFKGLKLNFNPETRELASNIWIKVGDKDAELYENKN